MEEKRLLKRKDRAIADGNRDQLAASCNALGDFYNEQGRYKEAMSEYKKEAEIYAKMGKKLNVARAHRMVGEMYMLLSEFDEAKEHIQLYLKIAKQLQNRVEEQRAYVTLGRAHLLHGQSSCETSAGDTLTRLQQAEKAFLKSLLLIKELTGQITKLEQLDMQARCYLNIGVVKEHMEAFEESIAYIEKAIKISRTHELFELTHLCYISMSMLYQYKKTDSTIALRYCNLALEVAKRLPNKVKKICETLMTKAEILIKEGDFASAKQILTKAYKKNTPDENDRSAIEKMLRVVVKICQILDELVTTSSVDYATRKTLYEKLGDGCCHLLNFGKAIDYYRLMLDCAEHGGESGKALVPIYVSLYQTYKDNRQYEQALEFLWKEYELHTDVASEAVTTLCSIAEVYELQQQPFWTVQDIYQRARDQLDKAPEGRTRAKLEKIIYVRLHKLQLKNKMLAAAVDLEEEAKSKGYDLAALADDSETESEESGGGGSGSAAAVDVEQNTPQLGDDVCLDELTDSDTSDRDESDKPLVPRAARTGARCLTIKRNNKGETQLHQACIAGNAELVRRLLDQGHVVNVRDHAGWIPLHEAANHGFHDIVELLLDRGAAVAINDKGGTSCDGITPLYDACANGFFEVIELLLQRGADTTLKTDFGDTCVDGLDKWRRSATLTAAEQAQYVQVRAALLRPLAKLGLSRRSQATPLTNAHVGEGDVTLVPSPGQEGDEDDEEEQAEVEWSRRTGQSSRRSSLGDLNRSGSGARQIQAESSGGSKTTPKKMAASVEYRHVMEQLKRPNRVPGLHSSEITSPVAATGDDSSRQKRGALLDSAEVADDDWLIDDIGPEKKKRRYEMSALKTNSTSTAGASTTPTASTSSAAMSKHTSKENLPELSNFAWDLDRLTPEVDAFETLREAAGSRSSNSRQKQARKLRLSRSTSISSTNSSLAAAASTSTSHNRPKHQTSLLENGFCRFRSESPLSAGEDSIDAGFRRRTIEPDSTTSHHQLYGSPTKSSLQCAKPAIAATVSFKVKVEDELLLVPIERKKLNDINIRWLAEEAARRYYNLIGLRPVLRLKTADGFAYEENDAVNVALEQNMILASVLEWKISALPQRYEEMCQQLKMDVDEDVKRSLERAQVSSVLLLQDNWLTHKQSEPLCKAILHQTNLRVIDLCNNFIQNEGCYQLAKALPTLRQLKSLSLRGNYITTEGLEAVLTAASGSDKLVLLEELNISQNPLGDACLRVLHSYCNGPAGSVLQQLHIAHCDLVNLGEYDLNFFELTTLDISFNQLADASLRWLVGKLNSCRLQELDMSYTSLTAGKSATAASVYAGRLATFFEAGTCEQFKRVSMAGCHLSDVEMQRIVECLSKASDLKALDVTDNCRLSESALKGLLEQLPQLRQLKATNCTGMRLDEEQLRTIGLLKRLPNFMSLSLDDKAKDPACADRSENLRRFWSHHWGDQGRVRDCGKGHFLLYVNDKDFEDYCAGTL